MLLYRPTGVAELRLVAASGWRSWPPRLSHQPVFYPVVTLEYARKIARDWNTTDESSGFAGFVARFTLGDAFAKQFPVQVAGGRAHEELWIPAERLDEMNRNISGVIEVIESFMGPNFAGALDPTTHLPEDLLAPSHS